jgi:hypothetical protein
LVSCRIAIEALEEAIDDENKNNEFDHPLFKCPIRSDHCKKTYSYGRPHWTSFESAVYKVQQNKEGRLSDLEKITLLKATKKHASDSKLMMFCMFRRRDLLVWQQERNNPDF